MMKLVKVLKLIGFIKKFGLQIADNNLVGVLLLFSNIS